MTTFLRLLRTRLFSSFFIGSLLIGAVPAHADDDLGAAQWSFIAPAGQDQIPTQIITALLQAQDGALWIGTQQGLVRYDGYQYRLFQPDNRDQHSLGSAYIRCLLQTRDGRIWVGSFSGGVSIYDPQSDRFTQLRNTPGDAQSLAHNRVESIIEDEAGFIWLATYHGLDRFDPRTQQFRHFVHDHHHTSSLASNQVRIVFLDSQQQLWIGGRNGLQRFDRAHEQFVNALPEHVSPRSITTLFEDSDQRLWIGSADKGVLLRDKNGDITVFHPEQSNVERRLSHFWISSILEAQNNEIWLGTFGGGIDIIDARHKRRSGHIAHDSAQHNSIGNDRIGALLRDRSGLIWVGSWGGGLSRQNPTHRAFRHFRYSNKADGVLSHPSVVRPLVLRNGEIWLGSNGNGIDVLNAQGKKIRHIAADHQNQQALSDGAITALHQDPHGSIFVATLDGVLHRWLSASNQFERYHATDIGLSGQIRAIADDPESGLWIGASDGLSHFDPLRKQSTVFHQQQTNGIGLAGVSAEALQFDAAQRLWIGTENGLSVYDKRNERWYQINANIEQPSALPDAWVPDILLTHHGELWFATANGVAILQEFENGHAVFKRLSDISTLPARRVESLIEDKQGFIWLGSRYRVDPNNYAFTEYGATDGNEFASLYIASRARTATGDLLFGSPQGLLWLHIDQLKSWQFDPQPRISAWQINGVTQAPLQAHHSAIIPPGWRQLRFEFGSNDLSAPDHNRFRYRIHDIDEEWTEVGADQRSLSFSQLSPGHYQFELQTGRAGHWSSQTWQHGFTIQAAWYQTWTFRIASWLLIIAIATVIVRWRLRHLRQRSALLEAMVNERTAELQAAYQRIEQISLTDPLTGLNNRRYFEQIIEHDLQLCLRQRHEQRENHHLAFLLLDLDHFKHVNDQYGHAAGDAVLQQTATLLKQVLRGSDRLIRWGGEEFLLVAHGKDEHDATHLAEKIRDQVAATEFVLPDNRRLRKTVSIGIARYPFFDEAPDAVDYQVILQLADAALYRVKAHSRNGWQMFVRGERLTSAHFAAEGEALMANPENAIAQNFLNVKMSGGLNDRPI